MVPLHKGKETDKLTNYRPISLLCTISKVLEKIVYKRIYEFLNKSNQISRSQYGFRANHGCDHAVGELLSEIVKNLQLGQTTVCLFLDLSKAFDTLMHDVILKKLEQYGIRGSCLKWMQSYLSNRRMLVKCASTSGPVKSQTENVTYGTPQGSCLGPLLFLVFCNDLELQLDYLRSIQFADDTTTYIGHKSRNYLEFCIEQDLKNLQEWFRANKLTLNIDKTVALIFDPKRMNGNAKRTNMHDTNQIRLTLNETLIPIMPHAKFLGLWVDENLNWKTHASKLELRIKTKICMLQRGRNMLTTQAKKILYFAQIHSLLTYGLVIWGNMISTTNRNRLQKLQDKGVQLISPHQRLSEIYKTHRILNLEQSIKLENIKLWYKYHRNDLPTKLLENMGTDHHRTSIEKQHGYNTRNRGIPNLPQTSLNPYKNSFLFKGLRDYQLSPQCIKDSVNIKQCTNRMKTNLLKN